MRKILFLALVSAFAFSVGGCVDRPLMSDEAYEAYHGPAPFGPDPTSHIPVAVDSATGRPMTN